MWDVEVGGVLTELGGVDGEELDRVAGGDEHDEIVDKRRSRVRGCPPVARPACLLATGHCGAAGPAGQRPGRPRLWRGVPPLPGRGNSGGCVVVVAAGCFRAVIVAAATAVIARGQGSIHAARLK